LTGVFQFSSSTTRNYDAEIFAFSKRLNEDFNETILKQAFVHPSYLALEKEKLKEIGTRLGATITGGIS
jgi:large subunit ribosomal protein L44